MQLSTRLRFVVTYLRDYLNRITSNLSIKSTLVSGDRLSFTTVLVMMRLLIVFLCFSLSTQFPFDGTCPTFNDCHNPTLTLDASRVCSQTWTVSWLFSFLLCLQLYGVWFVTASIVTTFFQRNQFLHIHQKRAYKCHHKCFLFSKIWFQWSVRKPSLTDFSSRLQPETFPQWIPTNYNRPVHSNLSE